MTDTCYTLATEGTSSTVISFVRLAQLPFPTAVYNSPLMFSFKRNVPIRRWTKRSVWTLPPSSQCSIILSSVSCGKLLTLI
ncbi:MAG: hypothetical protein ACTS6P_01280 [Candidatus Hodgkinia cicadicola]